MGKQLFGTDGIRGTAGEYPLDPRTVHAFGVALGEVASRLAPKPRIVIGMDTRESGLALAQQVAGGLAHSGVLPQFAGVITTPGVAFLTRNDDLVAGVMISASHNPYQDNGIKVFGHSGYKLPDEEEHAIEGRIFQLLDSGVTPAAFGLVPDPGLDQEYLEDLLGTISVPLDGLRLVIDCGNGAAYALAPELFRRAGAAVTAISCEPDGRNINLHCGSLHVGKLRETVLATGADAGVAFDGDADRAIFVSRSGQIINGDAVLLILARALKSHTVVATVMSNLGLEKALEAEGVRLLRTAVGDKYVLEEMLRTGAVLGGEQSGHVIFTQHSTTGDGLLTALLIFQVIRKEGVGLDELTQDLRVYPQRLVNVRVREKKRLAELPSVAREISECEALLAGTGRILVRFSGTEPLARVMVEARDLDQVDEVTSRIARAIQREIG